MGGVVKTLLRSNSLSRAIFRTAGSFGCHSLALARQRPASPDPHLKQFSSNISLLHVKTREEKTYTQGKTPWVDSVCADCPGFLVLGAAPAPASTFVSKPQILPLG